MEGQPRVRYEVEGLAREGVGVHSSRAAAAGKRPGKQANTSGADLRASEPSGYTAAAASLLYTVALRVLRSCRTVVVVTVAVDEPSPWSALGARSSLATRLAVFVFAVSRRLPSGSLLRRRVDRSPR